MTLVIPRNEDKQVGYSDERSRQSTSCFPIQFDSEGKQQLLRQYEHSHISTLLNEISVQVHLAFVAHGCIVTIRGKLLNFNTFALDSGPKSVSIFPRQCGYLAPGIVNRDQPQMVRKTPSLC